MPYIDRWKLMVKCVQSADKEMLITIIQLCWTRVYLQYVGRVVD